MSKHSYLRAYMAGIVLPTMLLLIGLAAFSVARFIYNVPVPIERVIMFPMAVVPNAWGVWNILYLSLRSRGHLPLGMHGALLVCVLLPAGFATARALDISIVTPTVAATIFPIALVVYYLLWKHVVGFFNEVLGIA